MRDGALRRIASRESQNEEAALSWNPAIEPGCPDAVGADAIETLIVPRSRDIGGFEVRRALPAPKRRLVGPFIFFDQMGPAEFIAGRGVDVRPHPHIGLATVTYLFRGEFQHRDSLGSNQIIHPGAVNWMVAGRGVTHSERTGADTRKRQTLPVIEGEGVNLRLIVGRAFGEVAPPPSFPTRSTPTRRCSQAPGRRCPTIMRIAAFISSRARSPSRARRSTPAR